MSKTFYGRINDKEYTSQDEFLKDLENVQGSYNVEYKINSTEQPVQEQVEKSTTSGVHTIFGDFVNKLNNENQPMSELIYQLEDDICKHFSEVDDELIERDLQILNNEIKDLQRTLVNIEKDRDAHVKSLKENQSRLNNYQRKLDDYKNLVEESIKYNNRLQDSINKFNNTLDNWKHLHDSMVSLSKEVDSWIYENMRDKWEKRDKKCDDCQCNKKQPKKPEWMSDNYFNLLKEIFG
jgi:DNA repair ATPase RecN